MPEENVNRPPSVINANINGLVSKQERLLSVLHTEQILAACLQETKTTEKSRQQLRLDGYEAFGWERETGKGGGVACIVATHYRGRPVTTTPSYSAPVGIEGRAVRIRIKDLGMDFTLASFYRPPKLKAEDSGKVEEGLSDWIARLGADGRPLIVAGDFNLNRGTRTAESMISLLSGLGLHFVSPATPTHKKSCIDWMLSNVDSGEEMANLLPPLEKADDGHRTIHYFLQPSAFQRIRVNNKRPAPPTMVFRWNLLDRNAALDLCSGPFSILKELPASDDPEEVLASIMNGLWKVAELTVPKGRNYVIGQEQPPWFTQECAEAFRTQKSAHSRHQKLQREGAGPRMLNNAYAFYRDMRRRWRATIVRARISFIQSAIAEARAKHRMWELYFVLSGKRNSRKAIQCLEFEGRTLTESKEIAEVLKDSFKRNFQESERKVKRSTEEKIKDESTVPPEALLSPLRCLEYMVKLHKKKAPGRDGLPSSLVRTLAAPLAAPVADLINLVITNQRIPSVWKSAWVAPIPKLNPATDPAHFRPISILPSLSKVFESHLRFLLHSQLPDPDLPPEQFGFQARSGCQDALIYIQEKALELAATATGTAKIALLSYDCSKAFDMLQWATVLDELCERGSPGWLLRLSSEWLRGRELRVRVCGRESAPLELFSSTPQGSLTGPSFFNIALSSAARLDIGPRAHLCFYADDATLICDVSTKEGEENLRRASNLYAEHIESLDLAINKSKSKLLICGFGNTRQHLSQPLMVGGEEIEEVKTARILGVDFDYRLSFTPHFQRLIGSAKGALGAISRLVGRDSQALSYIVSERVTPLLLYSLSSVLPSNLHVWDRLNGVSRYAARLAANDFQSPVDELMERAGIVSASQLALESSLGFVIRCLYKGRKFGRWLERGSLDEGARVTLRSYDKWRAGYITASAGHPALLASSSSSSSSPDHTLLRQVSTRHVRARKLYPYVMRALWNATSPMLLPLLDPARGSKALKELPAKLQPLRSILSPITNDIPADVLILFGTKLKNDADDSDNEEESENDD